MTLVYSEVVNLEVSRDRRERMQEAFAKAGVNPAFHPAVHFREVGEPFLLEHCRPQGPWGRTRPGHMALTISHMNAWKRFLDTDMEFCAVFEDDIFVSNQLGEWFEDLSWWPQDADLVKLEAWRGKSNRILLLNGDASWKGRSLQRLLTRHMGSAGYMITRAAARKLINARPYDVAIDHLLFNINASRIARELVSYQVVPALVTQGNEPAKSSHMDPADPITRSELAIRELRRGILELSYPVSTYWKLVSGAARFEAVRYLDSAEPNS